MYCIPKRYLIAFLLCWGFAFTILLQRSVEKEIKTWFTEDEGKHYINWPWKTAFTIFHFTFIIGQLTSSIGGIISNRYGGAIILGAAMLSYAFIHLKLDSLCHISFVLFIIVRFIEAMLHAMIYSSVADVSSRWSTSAHRSKYVSFTLAGYYLGSMIYELNVVLTDESNHRFIAIAAAVWAIVWLLWVKNDPSQDKTLSNFEKTLLEERIRLLDKKSATLDQYPWQEIFRCKSFWALNVIAFINGSSSFILHLILYHPIISEYTIEKIHSEFYQSFTLFIIYFVIFINTIIAGNIVDYLKNRNTSSSSKTLKIFMCVIFVAQSITLMAFSQAFAHVPAALILFTLISILRTCIEITIQVIAIDSSPRYASLVNGIQYSFHFLAILCLNCARQLLQSLPFIGVIAAFHIIGALLYYRFGSAELQSWNKSSNDEHDLKKLANGTKTSIKF